MAKIINKEIEKLNMHKFIGKKFQGDLDIPKLWQEWFAKDMFSYFDKLDKGKVDESYIGLMRWREKEEANYEYWIGVLVADDVVVPDGFETFSFPKGKYLTYYIKGEDGPNLYAEEGNCFKDVQENHIELSKDLDNYLYSFERYNCPRFTTPDENNEVILDFCLLIK